MSPPVHFPEHLRDDTYSAQIVGRKTEQAELRRCFRSVASGNGLLVCIFREAGVGKITIVENHLRLNLIRGHCIGRGRCSEHLLGSSANPAIFDVLDDLTLSSPDSDVARLLKRMAPCWYVQVFPMTAAQVLF